MRSKSLNKGGNNSHDHSSPEKQTPLNILPRSPKQQKGLSIGKKASENLPTSNDTDQPILLSVEDIDTETTVDTLSQLQEPFIDAEETKLNEACEADEFAIPQIKKDPDVAVLIPEESKSFKESFRHLSEELAEQGSDLQNETTQFSNPKPYSTKFFIKLIAFAACIILILLVVGVSKIAFTKKANSSNAEQLATTAAVEKSPSSTEKALERAQNNIQKSLKLAEQFLNAKTTHQILKICRDPQRVKPYIEEYYQSNILNYSSYEIDPEKFDIVQFGEGTATLLTAVKPDEKNIPICVVHSDSNHPVIDWESFVNLCEIPWDSLKTERPTSAVMMRAKLKPANYYNFIYNEEEWVCYRMSDMENQNFLYAYTQRDGTTDLKIQTQLGLDNDLSEKRSMTSAVTKVYFEEGAGKHQARLDTVLNFGTLLR